MTGSTKDIKPLLFEVARLYYEHKFSQQQIASKYGISRPGVSRLLQKARVEGIVKIEIIDPYQNGIQIENALKRKYKLKSVVVVPDNHESSAVIKDNLGKAAVKLLDQLITDGTILGISWGSTMQSVSKAMLRRTVKNMLVVQLNGGFSRAEYDTHASEIVQKIGENYRAIPYLLPLPAIVDTPELKNVFTSDKNISKTFGLARQSEIAIFTIGSFGPDSALVKADYFENGQINNLLADGAVGDICSRIINRDGEIISTELNARTIGIELDELKSKTHSIAVAGGLEKLSAIKAGLSGKWFNTLITDECVASELINT